MKGLCTGMLASNLNLVHIIATADLLICCGLLFLGQPTRCSKECMLMGVATYSCGPGNTVHVSDL